MSKTRRLIAATFTIAALGAAPFAITASSAATNAGGVEQLHQAGGVEQLGLHAVRDGGVEQLGLRAVRDGGVEQL